MPRPPIIRDAILRAIDLYGPMCARDMATTLQMPRSSINAAINHTRATTGTEVLRIASYRFNRYHGGREIPVYDRGPRPDCKRPELGEASAKKAKARYRERNRALIRVKDRIRRGSELPNPFSQLMR